MKNRIEKMIISTTLFVAIIGTAAAQQANVTSPVFGDWEAAKADKITTDNKENAVSCSGKGNVSVSATSAVKIDISKSYVLSGMFKLKEGSLPVKCFFGIIPLNAKGDRIFINQINYVKGTETELIDECSPEDVVLKIKNGENWKPNQNYCIACETDNSGNYSDLPNSRISSVGIVKVEKKEDAYEVTMQNRCRIRYPAGTKVRLHSSGSAAIYAGAAGKNVSSEWSEFKGIVKPAAIGNINTIENWWPGAEKAKIFISFSGDKSDSDISAVFKDIKIEEAK